MTDDNTVELNDQMLVRREKLETLREAGLDPFGKRFERDANSATLNAKYADKSKEDLHELAERATIAGRIMTKRGKVKSLSPTSKTAKAKSKSMSARITSATKPTIFSNTLTLATSTVLKVKSCGQTWASYLSKQIRLLSYLNPYVHCQKNIMA